MGLQTTGDLWLGKLLKDFEPGISSEKLMQRERQIKRDIFVKIQKNMQLYQPLYYTITEKICITAVHI